MSARRTAIVIGGGVSGLASAALLARDGYDVELHDRGEVVGSVNLYAASARAFEGLHDELATIFGAWAPGAVTNADLSFATRDTARSAPRTLQENAAVDRAAKLLAAAADLTADEARDR